MERGLCDMFKDKKKHEIGPNELIKRQGVETLSLNHLKGSTAPLIGSIITKVNSSLTDKSKPYVFRSIEPRKITRRHSLFETNFFMYMKKAQNLIPTVAMYDSLNLETLQLQIRYINNTTL